MFIEVLVIGIGSLVALSGVGAAAAGYDMTVKAAPIFNSAPAAAVAIAFSYALGILLDRCADIFLQSKRRSLRSRYFPSDVSYAAARRSISQFPELVARADYARSRMRVCRGWFLNSILLLFSANAVLIRFPVQDRSVLVAFASALGLLMVAGFYVAWSSITLTSYKKLHQQMQSAETSAPPGQDEVPENTASPS
ncbi:MULTISPECIES: hypothetical protein [Streptomyces]|uniref:hypothetical protein n=1 Tax=Streptomyces TaxID=1883 RepID=UPI001057455B|nr:MULTISPECIES: hypothetical protein [Streptomyces]THA94610.1 hypothetical protein E6R61_14310 [Streptomyces sp. LRa12]